MRPAGRWYTVGAGVQSAQEQEIAPFNGRAGNRSPNRSFRPSPSRRGTTPQASGETNTKADLYASAAIGDYWVPDRERRELTVFREPGEDAANPFGWRHTQTTVLAANRSVWPLAKPDAEVCVADLLPPLP